MNDQNEESGIYYYHADHLGSSSVVTDKNGKFHEHLEFFPYGETWINDRANNENLPYRFTGKELDPETGLYYYGARYYDSKLSRWISADPILKDYLPKNDFFRKNDKRIEKYFNSVYKRKPEKEDVQSFTAQKYFVLSYDIIDIKELKGIGGMYNVVNLNLYTYCANNPVRFVDPDGNEVVYDVYYIEGYINSDGNFVAFNKDDIKTYSSNLNIIDTRYSLAEVKEKFPNYKVVDGNDFLFLTSDEKKNIKSGNQIVKYILLKGENNQSAVLIMIICKPENKEVKK